MTLNEQLLKLSIGASRKLVYPYHVVTLVKFDKTELCAIEFKINATSGARLKAFYGFELIEDIYDSVIRVQMTGNNPSLTLFSSLCEFLLEKSTSVKSLDFHFILNSINEWIEFGKSQDEGLKHSLQYGLFGELLFLKELIREHGPRVGLLAWQGPNRNKVDFLISDGIAVEIKSSSDPLSSKVTISSLEQLDTLYENHILRRYALFETITGLTILELYREIANSLVDYQHRENLRQKLCDYGVNPFTNYTELLSLQLILFRDYDVTDSSFPKIIGPLSTKIIKLNYVINLSNEPILDPKYCFELIRMELQ
jgi:hypothetical protein